MELADGRSTVQPPTKEPGNPKGADHRATPVMQEEAADTLEQEVYRRASSIASKKIKTRALRRSTLSRIG